MGADIINAIKSGLGLIGDLASEFLDGFSTLFWDPTANTGAGGLTTFATYAMVMLGIAVTFAVISLVLGVFRGSSGV